MSVGNPDLSPVPGGDGRDELLDLDERYLDAITDETFPLTDATPALENGELSAEQRAAGGRDPVPETLDGSDGPERGQADYPPVGVGGYQAEPEPEGPVDWRIRTSDLDGGGADGLTAAGAVSRAALVARTAYILWLGTPESEREPRKLTEFCLRWGTTLDELGRWEGETGFPKRVQEASRDWLKNQTAAVLGCVYRNAIDVTRVDQPKWMDLFFCLTEAPFYKRTHIDAFDLGDE